MSTAEGMQLDQHVTHLHLAWVDPKRPLARETLGEDGNHTLHRPQDRAVDHHGPLRGALARHILQLKALWQLEVELDGRTLKTQQTTDAEAYTKYDAP